jgi:hypothetical protein
VLLAVLPAIASAEPAKPAKSRRAPRVKHAVTAKPPDASREQKAVAPAAASLQIRRSSVDAPSQPPPPDPAPPVAPTPAPVAPSVAPPPAQDAPLLPVTSGEASAAEPRRAWRPVTLTLNPAPMALGRYGGNLEIVPLPHHAIVLSGYMQTFPAWMLRRLLPSNVEVGAPPSRPGGEIGYRFYTGARGASGLFLGPSAVAMPIVYPHLGPDLKGDVASFYAYGGAFDIGLQAITDAGFTIGGGLGVMYLAYTPPASVTPPPGVSAPSFIEPHILPRALIAAGWSF